MSRLSTINPEGRWFKGNTHAHTNVSDASWPPSKLVAKYRLLGYDFTALTDHRIYGSHDDLSGPDFLILPGTELDVRPEGNEALCHHVVGLGLPGQNSLTHGQKIEYPITATVNDAIRILTSQGNLVIYAHPSWSHVKNASLQDVAGCIGVEIYNHGCEVGTTNGLDESHYDRLLWQGKKIWCVASDDTHQQEPDYGGGFVMVKAVSLTREAIIGALLSGSFYASQGGPLIEDFAVEDGVARCSCSPCRSIGFKTDSTYGRSYLDESGNRTTAEHRLNGSESYIRAVCVGMDGKKSWAQPIWLK